jgi:hypothetical protein
VPLRLRDWWDGLCFVAAFVGAVLGGVASYLVAITFFYRSRPRPQEWGWLWRPGNEGSPYEHEIDEGDLLKFWFRLKGRSSPGTTSLEIIYTPQDGKEVVSVFAKWDERANPESETRGPEGPRRTFHADRVPDTYYLPVSLGRIYTVPIVWRTPRHAYDDRGDDIVWVGSRPSNEQLLLFSGWWFDTSTARPSIVPTLCEDAFVDLVLSGSGFHWEQRFELKELVEKSPPILDAESDAAQEKLQRRLRRNSHDALRGTKRPRDQRRG